MINLGNKTQKKNILVFGNHQKFKKLKIYLDLDFVVQ